MTKPLGLADRSNVRSMHVVPAPSAGGLAAAEEDDTALVQAVRTRAPRAPGKLWDRYSTLSRRILRRMLGPTADVEDALQDVFLRLFRDLDSLREPAALRSFLIGITLHVAKTELRKRRARRWLSFAGDAALPEPEPPSGELHDEQREALGRLYRVLDRVGTEKRLVFVLRYVEGLELLELSVILGCSLATTKRRVADAARRVTLLAAVDPLLASYVAVTS
jgi:RNA polymerase sigma-70 factor (ECF subfamily)